MIRTVQQNLVTLGYTPGRVDGQMRSDTQQAIREFERRSGLPVTGRISGPLVAKLSASLQQPSPAPFR